MKKNLFKTSIVAGALLAFGFLMVSNTSSVKAQEVTPAWSWNAEVVLTIEQWELTIWISWSNAELINLGSWRVSNEMVPLTGEFWENSFWLSDQKWLESGYYTTLSVTNLSWDNNPSHVITKDNVFLQSTSLVTIEWATWADAGVSIWLSNSSWVSMASPVTYFTRWLTATDAAWMLWTYGDYLQVKVEVPAHTLADTYRGTITYTLYDWAQPSS